MEHKQRRTDPQHLKIHVDTLIALASERGIPLPDEFLKLLRDVSIAVQRVNNVPHILARSYRLGRSPHRIQRGLQRAWRTLVDTPAAGDLDILRRAYIERLRQRYYEVRNQAPPLSCQPGTTSTSSHPVTDHHSMHTPLPREQEPTDLPVQETVHRCDTVSHDG